MNATQLSGLLTAHGAALILFARQWCDCPEDVVQESFLKLVSQTHQPDDPAAWLYRTVRNAAIDAGKGATRRRRRENEVARSRRWFVETELEGLDIEQAVAALSALPTEQREVIVAHLWGTRSFEQIGELVGCSASSAHRRYTAGLKTLRERMGEP